MLNFLNRMTPLNENASVVVAISAKHEAGVCRPGGPPPPRRQSRGYGAPQGDFGERQYSERPAPEMRPGEQCSNSTCLPWSGTGDIGCSLYRQSPIARHRNARRLQLLSSLPSLCLSQHWRI